MNEDDFLEVAHTLAGEGMQDYDVGFDAKSEGIGRQLGVLLRGERRGVKYPLADRIGVLAMVGAALIVALSLGSLVVNSLQDRRDLGVILDLDRIVGEAILGMLGLIHSAGVFLLGNEVVALLLGLLLLVWLVRGVN